MAALYVQGNADKNVNLGLLMRVLRAYIITGPVVASPLLPNRVREKAIDVNHDGKLSKKEIRDWISSCPSVSVQNRNSLFQLIMRADTDLDGMITKVLLLLLLLLLLVLLLRLRL
jgi:hypothetical protein